MSDRYVIVYRDGKLGDPLPRNDSDRLLRLGKSMGTFKWSAAYRIRIREKNPLSALYGVARLNPAKAYADAGIRR